MFLPCVFAFAPTTVLASVGTADGVATEFALAPDGYARYGADPAFVAGRSSAKDWPYALPGPRDAWAGGRTHEDAIYFGVGAVLPDARCRLVIDLAGTQAETPPKIRVLLNDAAVGERQLTPGTGDGPILGHPEQGRRLRVEFDLPTARLTPGTNRLAIRSVAGSWAVFDDLRIEATGISAAPVRPEVRLQALPTAQAILRTPAGPRQTVRLEATDLGPPARRRFDVGSDSRTVDLTTGAQTIEFSVPPVGKTTRLTVRDSSGERTVVTVLPVRPWQILLFPHAHVDVGYTDLQADVERHHRQNLFDALGLARESAGNPPESRYRYNIEAAWVLERFLRNATPAEKAQVHDGLRRGDLAVTGGYANELTAAMRPEEMMQAYRDSRLLEDEFGVRIDTASQTDVPGVSWGDVTALHEAGIDNLVLMPNPSDRIGGIRAAWEDRPFWWIGPDGRSRVFTWPLVTYGMAHGFRPFDGNRDRIFRTKDPTKGFIDGYLFPLLTRYAKENYPYDLIGIPWSVTDNSPIDGDVPAAVKAWNARYVTPRVRISTLSDGCREFKARYGKKIPAERGDLTPYWEDGMGSSAQETGMNRASADRLVQAATVDAIKLPGAWQPEAFRDAWRDILLYTEHTWGAANSISEPDAPNVKAEWATKRQFALDADERSRELLGATQNCDWHDVLNTESWPRSGLITLLPGQSAGGDRVEDDKGNLVRSQRDGWGHLLVYVTDVPAFGTRRIHCVPGPPADGPAVRADEKGVSGPSFALTIDPKSGGIAHWFQDGRDWVKPGENLNAYRYLPGSDLKDLVGPTRVHVDVIEPGPLVAWIRETIEAPGTIVLVQDVRVVAGRPWIEISDDVGKKSTRAKEGIHFLFPFDVPNGQVRIDTPWAVIRPEFDQLPGANKNWFCTQRFVDVSNDSYGVTLTSLDAPLIEVGGITANLLGSVGLDEWRKHVEPTQTVASWAMNNHWHTNYRAEQGSAHFHYALWAHGPYEADAATRFGTEVAQPLVVRQGFGPPVSPLLTLSDARVIVTSLTPSDDGKAFLVRLYGASGADRRVALTWRPGTVRRMTRMDLTQRPGPTIEGPVLVPGNGVVTLRAERLPIRKPEGL